MQYIFFRFQMWPNAKQRMRQDAPPIIPYFPANSQKKRRLCIDLSYAKVLATCLSNKQYRQPTPDVYNTIYAKRNVDIQH